jgi:hypothetical protein
VKTDASDRPTDRLGIDSPATKKASSADARKIARPAGRDKEGTTRFRHNTGLAVPAVCCFVDFLILTRDAESPDGGWYVS